METESKKQLRKHAYTAAQWTWGLPQTLAGAVLYLAHRKDEHFDYRGARATAWDKDTGISLGKFIFVPKKSVNMKGLSHTAHRLQTQESNVSTEPDKRAARSGQSETAPLTSCAKAGNFLLEHEYGHTLQSLILGPFYLLLVGAPSMLWNRLPYFKRKRERTGKSYYSAPFERSANYLASKRLKPRTASKKSMESTEKHRNEGSSKGI